MHLKISCIVLHFSYAKYRIHLGCDIYENKLFPYVNNVLVIFNFQHQVEMNWNICKYLPTSASCQNFFQVKNLAVLYIHIYYG